MATDNGEWSYADTDEEILTRIAWYYYNDGLTQNEIGEKLNMSRIKVSRLLESGRRSGIIQVRINSRYQGCLALENSFNQVGLDHVALVKLASTAVVSMLLGLSREQSLAALSTWDRAGHDVDRVAVNLSAAELRDPSLPNRLAWEIDRHDLTPDRLTVEVLESVISDAPDDIISRNIAALAELGCGIDLDDFGTGHASITSIRRFAVSRIKIDRSFVSRLDTDREQQRMVAAILTMCERLELGAVAEGVETPGEHTILAQLGCGHVQGFGIARPMPFDETLAWLDRHRASLTAPPDVCRRTG